MIMTNVTFFITIATWTCFQHTLLFNVIETVWGGPLQTHTTPTSSWDVYVSLATKFIYRVRHSALVIWTTRYGLFSVVDCVAFCVHCSKVAISYECLVSAGHSSIAKGVTCILHARLCPVNLVVAKFQSRQRSSSDWITQNSRAVNQYYKNK